MEQVFWFLLFIGWIPLLGSYAFVLDPITAEREGIINTIIDRITLYEQRAWGHPAFGVLTVIGVLAAALVVVLKQRYLWPVPVFLLWSSLIYIFNVAGSGDAVERSVHIIYAVLAFISTYLFLRHGHLLSASYIGFITLLVVDVAAATVPPIFGFTPGFSLIGTVFSGYAPNLVNVLLFLTVSVLVRMIWLMVRDNRHFVKSMSRKDLGSAVMRTLKLWFLAPVVFVIFATLWWVLVNLWLQPQIIRDITTKNAELREDLLTETVTAMGPKALGSPQDALNSAFTGILIAALRQEYESILRGIDAEDPDTAPFERVLNQNAELQLLLVYVKQRIVVIKVRVQGLANIDELPGVVNHEMNAAFPVESLPTLEYSSWCFFLDFPCQIERSIKRGVNNTLRETRAELIAETTQFVQDQSDAAVDSVDGVLNDTETKLRLQYENAVLASRLSIETGFRTWRNLSLLATLYSVIILLKTFLIVFSRVVLAPKPDNSKVARFLPDAMPEGRPNLKRHKQTYVIPISEPVPHFVARWGVTLEGPPPARRRPLGLSMPIARITTGTWVMNKIDGNRARLPDQFDAVLKVDEPAELVSWTLREGERVVFRFSDFIGMSETLTVGRITSLGITTLILGRMIYHYAEGPGVLILRTTAAARIGPSEMSAAPAPMPKLVAWGSSTRFNIFAALTLTDTFLSGYNMKTGEGDAVVWDTSNRRGDGPGTGIMRFLKSFILPI